MDESERDSPAENHGESASTALANLVDPVVAVDDGTVTVANGAARDAFEVPESGDVRSIVDALEVRHPRTTVRSIRRRERAVETRQEFAARIEETLTDRQLGVLQRAYHAGYFEWPRPTTGEELAASMGISRPTFHEHLRMAELKLCRALFEGE